MRATSEREECAKNLVVQSAISVERPAVHILSRRKGLDIMFKSLLDEAIQKTAR